MREEWSVHQWVIAAESADSNWISENLGLAFWAGVIISGVVGVVLTRTSDRWLAPLEDHELWVDYHATPLFTATPSTAKNISPSVDGVPTSAPYQVRLWIWRAGKKDVRADSFSGDFMVNLGVPVISSTVRADEHTATATAEFLPSESSFRIKPSIVRTDFLARYDFVSDGLPDLQSHNPVADLRVSSFYDDVTRRNRGSNALGNTGGWVLIAGIIWLVGWTIAAVPADNFGFFTSLALYGFVGIAGGVIMLAASGGVIPRRARLARRVLNRRVGARALPAIQVAPPARMRAPGTY